MLAKQLTKAWEARRASPDHDTDLRFTDQGLTLGAGTVLAPAGASPRDVCVDPRDPRLVALLVAAHLARPTGGQLVHLAKAADRRREGQDALAAVHLALSGLSRLAAPRADAHRLFLADGLLKAGARPAAVLAALGRLAKFDPDQARVPAGSGRPSGQWTADGGDAAAAPTMPGAQTPSSGASPSGASPSGASNAQSSDVNPSTVTPAAERRYVPGFPYHGEDACRVALEECEENAVADYRREQEEGAANDNGPNIEQRWSQCHKQADLCLDIEALVEKVPKVIAGVSPFPDGGRVAFLKNYDPVYLPRNWKGHHPPAWRMPPPK